MKKIISIVQISFTYAGTVVGAGFASGQEILQFFTRYGWMATLTIGLASVMFVWLGIKMMLLAHRVGATSYEDMNVFLFGPKFGNWISLFTLVILFGVTTVMLAGAGSIFAEQLGSSYQLGLAITLVLAYFVLSKGMSALMMVNTIVVPMMIFFSCALVWFTWDKPGAENWLHMGSDSPVRAVWSAPFLYCAFNLAMAQAVLVPLGAQTKDRSVLLWGGIWGGAGIGLMLLAGHYALAAQMPDISQFDIPMGNVIKRLGPGLQAMFILIIYGEIFTTYVADAYGLTLQLKQRFSIPQQFVIIAILVLSYIVSQFGFKTLLSSLYPLFGAVSLAWMTMLIWRRHPVRPHE
ncbi:hypothetical protein [Paenibacillus thalictri]|uniref:Transporter n=1 Tax=Paenibacillus thalictri TaxID=2527873 RepID=A0A4Q9DLA3_9BACL|nr:hypothetical protein [Paenibacillus thalictri]TBL73218.1 hypothetical protein EYB31_26400 [Paenibacillus thalictri]